MSYVVNFVSQRKVACLNLGEGEISVSLFVVHVSAILTSSLCECCSYFCMVEPHTTYVRDVSFGKFWSLLDRVTIDFNTLVSIIS